jgi:hypothetical protein
MEMTDDHGVLSAARKAFKKHTKKLEKQVHFGSRGDEAQVRAEEILKFGIGQFSEDPKKRARDRGRFRERIKGY